jgi:RND family efflux transporter MFP subunit
MGLIILLSLAGCPGRGEKDKVKEKAAERPPVAIEAAEVRAGDLTEGIEVVGTLASKFESEVKSEYAGIVSEVYVTEWVRVKKGTPLARLDTREGEVVLEKARAAGETARANLLQAEVVENRAKREYDRALKLKEVGLITQQNLDDARTEEGAAAARISAAQAQLKAAQEDARHAQTRLSKAVIQSPLDGVVAWRGVNVGEFVGEMGSPKIMFKIVDNRVLDLTVTVPSRDMGRIRVGQVLTFTTDTFPGKTFSGRVRFVNPQVAEADRSVKVMAEVPNSQEFLKGGLFVKGEIITGQKKGVLQMPRTALITWDKDAGKGEVFQVKDQKALRRPLRTGAPAGGEVEVVSGLSAGDQVVTRGGFNLKDGDPVRIIQGSGEK